MNNGRFDLASLRLVAITDSLHDGIEGLTSRARAAIKGGATMIQLRLESETPRALVEIARSLRSAVPEVPLIVNSRFDVALAAEAQGVHLGVDDVAPAAVRSIVAPEFIIGVSVGHSSEAPRAEGADYVGIGPVFGAAGGTDGGAIGIERFVELALLCRCPSVAIGGVSARNVGDVMRTGANGVAVISALFGAHDPETAARFVREAQDASER